MIGTMARNSLLCADVPLRNYSLTHSSVTALTYTDCDSCSKHVTSCDHVVINSID